MQGNLETWWRSYNDVTMFYLVADWNFNENPRYDEEGRLSYPNEKVVFQQDKDPQPTIVDTGPNLVLTVDAIKNVGGVGQLRLVAYESPPKIVYHISEK